MEDNNEVIIKDENGEIKYNKMKICANAITLAAGIVISVMVLVALYVVIKPDLSLSGLKGTFTQEQIDRLSNAIGIINNDFLYDYDSEKLLDGAIDGMVSSLDNQFTYYEDEEEYLDSENSGSKSTYYGIGVHVVYDPKYDAIRVLGVMPDSPAQEAGIKAGDIITKVDDMDISIDTYIKATDAIKGEENTTVKLKVTRGNETLNYEIVRQKLTEHNVTTDVIDGIGYMRVYSFDNGIYDQFKTEYEKLRAQGIKGLVIDLRNNPGGIVNDTVEILDLLLPKCEVLRLVDKNNKTQIISTRDDKEIDIPLTILVNENSASASEILASAIKDYNKGTVIGTKTFGKGVVQYVERIPNHGAITLVHAQYFTPSGVVIQDNGIEPNILVELPEEIKNDAYIDYAKDLQLQKAIEVIKEQL